MLSEAWPPSAAKDARAAARMRARLSLALGWDALAAVTVAGLSTPGIVAGFPVERTAAGFLVCVTGDEAGVRARIAGQFAMAGQVPEYRAVLDREGADGPQDIAIVGDEETVARRIAELAGLGIGELMACPFGDAAEQARTVSLLQAV